MNIDNVRAHLTFTAGVTDKKAIDDGIAYALENGCSSSRGCYILAISRILYSDSQLADGGLFSVDEGWDPDDEVLTSDAG